MRNCCLGSGQFNYGSSDSDTATMSKVALEKYTKISDKDPHSSGRRFLHHFDDDPDPDPHHCEKSDADPQHWLVLELYRVSTLSVLTLQST